MLRYHNLLALTLAHSQYLRDVFGQILSNASFFPILISAIRQIFDQMNR